MWSSIFKLFLWFYYIGNKSFILLLRAVHVNIPLDTNRWGNVCNKIVQPFAAHEDAVDDFVTQHHRLR